MLFTNCKLIPWALLRSNVLAETCFGLDSINQRIINLSLQSFKNSPAFPLLSPVLLSVKKHSPMSLRRSRHPGCCLLSMRCFLARPDLLLSLSYCHSVSTTFPTQPYFRHQNKKIATTKKLPRFPFLKRDIFPYLDLVTRLYHHTYLTSSEMTHA